MKFHTSMLYVVASVLLLFPLLTRAQAQSETQLFRVPAISNATRVPACASSANGTGHLICVVGDLYDNLFAVSILTESYAFPSAPLDPPTVNPMPLGIIGQVEYSSCASTADTSGDVVCAYTAPGGEMKGMRFNVFNGKVYPPQDIGLRAGAGVTCANGSERFTVKGPATSEGPEGATICAADFAGPGVTGFAFNPATGYLRTQAFGGVSGNDGGIRLNSGLSCANSNDGKNQIICALRLGPTMQVFAFDPRPTPQFATAMLQPYSNVSFDVGHPSCSSPNDRSGQVICGFRNGFNLVAFAVDPRSGFASPLVVEATSNSANPFVGSASCSGEGKSTVIPNGVICLIGQPFLSDFGNNLVEGFIFDPRKNLPAVAPAELLRQTMGDAHQVESQVSCTFQNINPDQVSCGAINPNGEFFAAILTH